MVWGPPPIDTTKTTELRPLGGSTLPERVITDDVLASHTAEKQSRPHGAHRRPRWQKRLPAVPWDRVVVGVSMAVAVASAGTALLVVTSSGDAPAVRQSQPSPSPSRVVAPVSSRPSVKPTPSQAPERPVEAGPKPLPVETWTVRPKVPVKTSAPSPTASASPSATATPKPTATQTATPTATTEPTVGPTPEEIPSPEDTTEDDTRSPNAPWWATPTGDTDD
jgi:hypothetical protein